MLEDSGPSAVPQNGILGIWHEGEQLRQPEEGGGPRSLDRTFELSATGIKRICKVTCEDLVAVRQGKASHLQEHRRENEKQQGRSTEGASCLHDGVRLLMLASADTKKIRDDFLNSS